MYYIIIYFYLNKNMNFDYIYLFYSIIIVQELIVINVGFF